MRKYISCASLGLVFVLSMCEPLFAQTVCECDAMVVPVFQQGFSSSEELREEIWDLDLQTHSRVWDFAPEQQYYVNTWHTWLDPEDLTDFSYSSQAGSDVLTMKI